MAQQPVLDIQHWETSQNTPVYFVHTPELPMLDIRVIFNAGSAHDGDQPGLADLTSGLFDEGTSQLSANEIAQQLDSLGAIYRAAIRHDMVSVALRSLVEPQFLTPALDLFVQMISDSKFAEEPFERVRKQILTGLDAELQQPATVAKKAFFQALYANHPYRYTESGTVDSVTQLTREDVVQFYQRYFTATNAIVVMVGQLDTTQAQQIAERLMKNLPAGNAAPTLPIAVNAPSQQQKITFPSQQTTIYLGQVGITPQDPDYFPLQVGNYTLGSGGMVARLFDVVREKHGLVYGIHSSFLPMQARGPFSVTLQTRNDQAEKAIALTKEVLRDFVTAGPTAAELNAAKKNIIGGFPLEIAGNSDILGQLMRIALYHLPLTFLDTYRDNVGAVTEQQIVEAFRRHVPLDDLVMVQVGE